MRTILLSVSLIAAALAVVCAATNDRLDDIDHIVVIYAENRSFDVLYGAYPGADGLKGAQSRATGSQWFSAERIAARLDRPHSHRRPPPVTEAQTAHLPNKPFAIDDPAGLNTPDTIVTRDLVHRFYQNQMQIDGGRNDKFVAWADSGALTMGHYDGSKLKMWNVAKHYTIADHFFMGAFGGSFMNHIWLICACVAEYPNADKSPARPTIAAVEDDGITLKLAPNSPPSALAGTPKYLSDGNLTPDFFAVNTMYPPYQPSYNKPAPGGDPAMADPANPTTLPPQKAKTIGDLLSAKGISWAWYGGAWQAALSGKNAKPVPNFQFHHQPFNYFADMAPGTAARVLHLKDGGLEGAAFIRAIDDGKLEHVVFYKPQGNLNEHAGYADVQAGDAHIADVVSHLENSPQWRKMVVIVTYDENGGFWDHVAPPKGDRWGPGTRIPAIVISPFSKQGYVDHTPYDTTSILRLITKRFGLPVLPGIEARDEVMKARGERPLGDLTNALVFPK